MDALFFWLLVGIGIAIFFGSAIYYGQKKREELDNEAKRYLTHYKCPYCESTHRYTGEVVPKNITCSYCDNKFLLYEGTITLKKKVGRDTKAQKDIEIVKEYSGLKTRELKSGDTYHQKIEDKRIDIRDSVIQRSNIGESSQKQFSICPYCGEDLNFKKTPKFCPYCREEISM